MHSTWILSGGNDSPKICGRNIGRSGTPLMMPRLADKKTVPPGLNGSCDNHPLESARGRDGGEWLCLCLTGTHDHLPSSRRSVSSAQGDDITLTEFPAQMNRADCEARNHVPRPRLPVPHQRWTRCLGFLCNSPQFFILRVSLTELHLVEILPFPRTNNAKNDPELLGSTLRTRLSTISISQSRRDSSSLWAKFL